MGHRTETITTPLGHRITFIADDYIGGRIRKYGLYEYTALQFLLPLLVRMGSPVVLDIGANIGNHALAFSHHAKAVYAFEPIPEIFQLLKENITQNGLDHVHALNRALSDDTGDATIYINRAGNLGSSSLYQRNNQSESQTIRRQRGDDALAELGLDTVDFIKLDVEGHELNVIQGLEGTLGRCRPLVLMEWNEEEATRRINEAAVFDDLFSGYEFFVLGNNRDLEYWAGRRLPRLRRGLSRRLMPKRSRLYAFDRTRIYKNILLVPREKLDLLPASMR